MAVTTDTHYWPGSTQCFGSEGEQLQPWFEVIHGSFLDEMRSVSPDILIHLGDFSCGGGVFQMPDELFFNTLRQIDKDYRAAAPCYYALPGNHDCPFCNNDYTFCERLLGLSSRLGRSVDTDAARLVFLHAQGHSDKERQAVLPKDPTSGWVTDAELARLDESLSSAGDLPVIMFTHQLLHPWANPTPYRDLYAISNGDAVLDLMAKHGNVRAVFQGHAHLLDVQEVNVGAHPVHFIVSPSLVQFPLGWLLLTLTPAALRVQYCPLPLPELSERSRTAGAGSSWRTPDPAWHDFTVHLAG